jgi:hypothetical protein
MKKRIRVKNPLTGLYFELHPNFSRYGHAGEIAGIWERRKKSLDQTTSKEE